MPFTKRLPFLPHLQNNTNNWLTRSFFVLKTALEVGEVIRSKKWKTQSVAHNAEGHTNHEENLNKSETISITFLLTHVPLSKRLRETTQPAVHKPGKNENYAFLQGGMWWFCTICNFRITEVNGIQRTKQSGSADDNLSTKTTEYWKSVVDVSGV